MPLTVNRVFRKMTDVQELLLGLTVDMSNGKLPTVKEVWRAGDLEPKLEKLNQSIKRIRSHWQVETKNAEQDHKD